MIKIVLALLILIIAIYFLKEPFMYPEDQLKRIVMIQEKPQEELTIKTLISEYERNDEKEDDEEDQIDTNQIVTKMVDILYDLQENDYLGRIKKLKASINQAKKNQAKYLMMIQAGDDSWGTQRSYDYSQKFIYETERELESEIRDFNNNVSQLKKIIQRYAEERKTDTIEPLPLLTAANILVRLTRNKIQGLFRPIAVVDKITSEVMDRAEHPEELEFLKQVQIEEHKKRSDIMSKMIKHFKTEFGKQDTEDKYKDKKLIKVLEKLSSDLRQNSYGNKIEDVAKYITILRDKILNYGSDYKSSPDYNSNNKALGNLFKTYDALMYDFLLVISSVKNAVDKYVYERKLGQRDAANTVTMLKLLKSLTDNKIQYLFEPIALVDNITSKMLNEDEFPVEVDFLDNLWREKMVLETLEKQNIIKDLGKMVLNY
jgi:hypothetical protein